MLPTGIEQLTLLSAAYERKGYALIPQLVDPVTATAWEFKYRAAAGEEGPCGA